MSYIYVYCTFIIIEHIENDCFLLLLSDDFKDTWMEYMRKGHWLGGTSQRIQNYIHSKIISKHLTPHSYTHVLSFHLFLSYLGQ